MMVIILSVRFPKVIRKEDEIVGAWETHIELFKQKTVILFFLGIFAYVGTEQGIANWISEFLRTYHGFKPEAEGGAIFSLLIGKLKDLIGLQSGMMILYLLLAYILSLSFWAKPIVNNATIRRKTTT